LSSAACGRGGAGQLLMSSAAGDRVGAWLGLGLGLGLGLQGVALGFGVGTG
jgi:hypothetical protein